MKFKSLLVANRGEIALRILRTARRMGLRTVAVYSDADQDAPHVRAADEAVRIGGPAPRDSYLNIKAVLSAPGEAVHPGYGFLSENPAFAEAVLKSGRVWVGPPPAAIRAMGDKANAKAIAAQAGVPILPTYDQDPEYPVMIKALAGGGGRGMRLVTTKGELAAALKSAQSEAEHAFGDGRVLLEKALLRPRHVEVQVFADSLGNCVHLGERDCSVQRRHQKLIEESPSPAVDAKLRAAMGEAAIAAAKAVGYVSAGTVEFLLEDGRFWFMEMNTRLQVEHPVTELVTGFDLVEWQLRVADGEPLPAKQAEVRFTGHAIEARLCAEDPARDFLPQAGTLAQWQPSTRVRVDHALASGIEIPPFYDSLVAKLIAHAPTRNEARAQLATALEETVAVGVATNKDFLAAVLRDRHFANGEATTDFLAHFEPEAGDFGEWSGWSNNPAHRSRGSARFFERHASRSPLRGRGAGDGKLLAPMNGRVVAVNAKAGETVPANKVLVVLEAMKMEHGLDFLVDVKVKAVHVAAGEQVAPGKLLMELEPAA
ncbi:MAG: 3-methylcrotonyl-CoA carboxylase [Betaproteobacteria bacterium]|nr:3-methylcrotonyl-CoA carboxylase [Betaproteobacteria bacterium]